MIKNRTAIIKSMHAHVSMRFIKIYDSVHTIAINEINSSHRIAMYVYARISFIFIITYY